MTKTQDKCKYDWAQFKKPVIKRFEYYSGEATIQLNKNLIICANITIKFRSLIVECKELYTKELKGSLIYHRFPQIVSIECAQLSNYKNKNDELINELIKSID